MTPPPQQIERWPHPESRSWLIPTIAVKLILALALGWQTSLLFGRPLQLYIDAGDTDSYIQPIEQLLTKGRYIGDPDKPDTAAGRMPGYGLTYLGPRLFLSVAASKSALVLVQAILSGASTYYLALCAFLWFRRRDVFYATLVLYGTNLFVSVWDNYILTESLAASAVIFLMYSLFRFRERQRQISLLQAAFWYAYLVFLRPFTVPIFAAAAFIVWSVHRRSERSIRMAVVDLFLVASIFLASDLGWMLRNYAALGRAVPLQVDTTAGYQYSEGELSLRAWLVSIGQDPTWWQPNNMASWFYRDSKFTNDNYQIPPYVQTATCSMADITRARTLFVAARASADRIAESRFESELLPIISECRNSFKREKPFTHYVVSPLRRMKTLLVHSGPILPLPPSLELVHHPVMFFVKLVAVGLYWLALITGCIGMVPLMRSGLVGWAIAWPFVFVLLFFVFVIPLGEARFVVTGFPSLCVAGAYVLASGAQRFHRSNRSPASSNGCL